MGWVLLWEVRHGLDRGNGWPTQNVRELRNIGFDILFSDQILKPRKRGKESNLMGKLNRPQATVRSNSSSTKFDAALVLNQCYHFSNSGIWIRSHSLSEIVIITDRKPFSRMHKLLRVGRQIENSPTRIMYNDLFFFFKFKHTKDLHCEVLSFVSLIGRTMYFHSRSLPFFEICRSFLRTYEIKTSYHGKCLTDFYSIVAMHQKKTHSVAVLNHFFF